MRRSQITVRELSEALNIGHPANQTILHQVLNRNKVTARWLPKTLTEQMRQHRIAAWEELHGIAQRERPNHSAGYLRGMNPGFISLNIWTNVIVGSAANQLNPPCNPKTEASAGKRRASVFWNSRGILLVTWLPEGQTISSAYYCEVLCGLLQAIKREVREVLGWGFSPTG